MDSRVPPTSPQPQRNSWAAHQLFRMTSDAVLSVDEHGTIIGRNPQAQLLLGLRRDGADDAAENPLPPEMLACLRHGATQQQLRLHGSWRGECVIGHATDAERTFDLRIFHDGYDAELSRLSLIIARETTNERAHERHVQERADQTELRFRRMADVAPTMIWKSGTDPWADYFNQCWLEFTGRSLGDERNGGWLSGVHPEDRERCSRAYRHAFAEQAPLAVEYRLRRHDGAFRWLRDTGKPCFDANGRLEGFVGVCTDITEHKALQEQLQRQTDEQTHAAARKDEFLAMLSHELRNPLAPISSSIAVMRRFDNIDPLLTQSHGVIDRQVENLRQLINDLLDVVRINSGKINLKKGIVSLNEIIDRALETSRPDIDQAAHTLSVSMAPPTAYVNGDPMRLAQALSNLLSNAAKFTPTRGKISIRAAIEQERGILTVKDNGAGISQEFRPRLFDLFAQADDSLARTQGGLGVGLAIAHQIVSLHDGLIEVNSDGVGAGSEFTLALPLADQGEISMHEQPTAVSDNAPAAHDFRVLLIDDNEDANESMAALLELLGYQVRTATDGEAALQVAQEFEPQLILSDIGLPGMDGYQLAPALRKVAGERKVIIAAATGYGHASDRLRSQAAGFDHHLVKPLDADTLLNFVAQQAASY